MLFFVASSPKTTVQGYKYGRSLRGSPFLLITKSDFAFNKASRMLTDPIRSVPFDWLIIRLTIVAVVLTSFAMFFVYAVKFMHENWPY